MKRGGQRFRFHLLHLLNLGPAYTQFIIVRKDKFKLPSSAMCHLLPISIRHPDIVLVTSSLLSMALEQSTKWQWASFKGQSWFGTSLCLSAVWGPSSLSHIALLGALAAVVLSWTLASSTAGYEGRGQRDASSPMLCLQQHDRRHQSRKPAAVLALFSHTFLLHPQMLCQGC